MKKLAIALVAVFSLCLGGCRAIGDGKYESTNIVGAKAAELHEGVFGCWPKGYEPPRILDAQGPKEDTCGRPVYKRPACSEVK